MTVSATEKQQVHDLFLAQDYGALYKVYPQVINLMLGVSSQDEFADYLEFCEDLEEEVFWLYFASWQGESLRIDGYEGHVASKVINFLQKCCPQEVLDKVQEKLQDIQVNLDDVDNIQEIMASCNQILAETDYQFQLDFEDIYCPYAYFLSVKHKAI